MSRAALLLLVAAFSPCTASFVSGFELGPERAIAPATTALREDGRYASLAASPHGFLAVWNSTFAPTTLMRRYDASGLPIDTEARALPAAFYMPGVVWSGSSYLVAGSIGSDLYAMRVAADGTLLDAAPRLIQPDRWAVPRLSSNGTSVLITWSGQSGLTQSITGMLLSPDLHVIRSPFVIGTRDVTGVQQPLKRDASHSVATDGRSWLVAWENVRAPESHTFFVVDADGTTYGGATVSEGPFLQPRVVADRAGFIVIWRNATTIRAMRVGSDGTPLTSPVELVSAEGVADIAVGTNGRELAVTWTAASSPSCPYPMSAPERTVHAARFDAAFRIVDGRVLQSRPALIELVPPAAVPGGTIATLWMSSNCSNESVVRTASLEGQGSQIVSFNVAPSVQAAPAVASDGTGALVVWSERRGADTAARIYTALLDGDAQVISPAGAIDDSASDAAQTSPRVAFGGGRYLVLWRHPCGLTARFVTPAGDPEGAPFVVSADASDAALAWDGSEFVVAKSDEAGLWSARIAASGAVRAARVLRLEGNVLLGDLAAGPRGEVAAVYRTETASEVAIGFAMLGASWSSPQKLATARRPCLSLACPDYTPFTAGWSGGQYAAVWGWTGGPGRGVAIETAVPGNPVSRLVLAYDTGKAAARMVWNESHFVIVYTMTGLSAAGPRTQLMKLDSSGLPLEPAPGLQLVTTETNPADLARISAARIVTVYTRLSGPTERVFARTVRTPAGPRRRSVSSP